MPDCKDMDEFEAVEIETGEASIFARWSGSGPPVLLLHGFPQTHLMWRDVAPILARTFTVVCADLRGYGRSGCPTSTADHSPYAKRTMARDMVAVMDRLGHSSFFVAGHDCGARVAYRMAMDHPRRVDRLAVLDIVPTAVAWDRSRTRDSRSHTGRGRCLPNRSRSRNVCWPRRPRRLSMTRSARGGHRQVYSRPRCAPPTSRRSPTLRMPMPSARSTAPRRRSTEHHDEADRLGGKRISCPLLALWSATGPLDFMYSDEGGPLGLWRNWASAVEGRSIDGGHFFPEEAPAETADALHRFFTR